MGTILNFITYNNEVWNDSFQFTLKGGQPVDLYNCEAEMNLRLTTQPDAQQRNYSTANGMVVFLDAKNGFLAMNTPIPVLQEQPLGVWDHTIRYRPAGGVHGRQSPWGKLIIAPPARRGVPISQY